MKTTPTFDAIHGLVKTRNGLIDQRNAVRAKLRGSLDGQTRQECEIEFWHLVGRIDGINSALSALRDAGEKVGSAEYLVIEEARQAEVGPRR